MNEVRRTWWVVGVAVALALLSAGAARADQVKLNVALANPLLKADKKQATYLMVGLTGFKIAGQKRAPVNVAIVLDKSGSMTGEKIRKAKEAAIMAVNRLRADDIVSVVAYDDTIEVLVPATKALDKEDIIAKINRLEPGNTTALFAGVSRGAQEVRKFLDKNRVNRIVLLSDGLANVGPSSPRELADLGGSLGKEGIGVTTIGLGLDYNEDLMTQLAIKSEGNHFFAEKAGDLERGFDLEFGIGLAVVAQEIMVRIVCAPGIRPVRMMNATADITDRTVLVSLNQLYSERRADLLLEIEVPATASGKVRGVANVEVTYANMATKTTDRLTSEIAVKFVDSEVEVTEKTEKVVMVVVVEQIANEQSMRATELRDKGKIEDARKLLLANGSYLRENGRAYGAEKLLKQAEKNEEDAGNLDEGNWKHQRKDMRDRQQEASAPACAF